MTMPPRTAEIFVCASVLFNNTAEEKPSAAAVRFPPQRSARHHECWYNRHALPLH